MAGKHLRFESALAGANFSYAPGDVVLWPDEDEADRFVERGIAEELAPQAAETAAQNSGRPVRTHRRARPETATRTAPEKAATR